ncbi:MAG: S8 family serine peptidase [Hyphomicrobium sp.]
MFVPGELIVGYKTPADRDAGLALLQAKQGLLLLNGEEAQDVKVERLGPSEARLQVTLPAGIKALAKSDAALERKVLDDLAAKLLAADATILYAHPNWITTIDPIERSSVPAPRTEARDRALTADAPNDPYFTLGRHWHYQPAPAGMNALGAWRRSTGEQTIVVAIIDTGIVSNHGDVAKQNLLPGYTIARSGRKAGAKDDADCTGYHGSHVAGTVDWPAPTTGWGLPASTGTSRFCPSASFDSSCTGASTVDVADAIRWAAGLPVDGLPNNKHPAQVINLSVGASVPCTFSGQRLPARGGRSRIGGGNGYRRRCWKRLAGFLGHVAGQLPRCHLCCGSRRERAPGLVLELRRGDDYGAGWRPPAEGCGRLSVGNMEPRPANERQSVRDCRHEWNVNGSAARVRCYRTGDVGERRIAW